jgi:hypothetical protein
MGPAEAGVQGASHYLAAVVDAGAYGGKISRQSAEVCEYAVLPKRGIFGCVVSTADYPNNLALVVNALGGSASSEVLKRCVGRRSRQETDASEVSLCIAE